MGRVLVISLDAVGDLEFDRLCGYPSFGRLAAQSQAVRGADSIFLTNTYPVHTSIATGRPQREHGIISNTQPFPEKYRPWNYHASAIQTPTLWSAAKKRGLTTAAVLWPVTCGARDIRYNIPEIMTYPGENQRRLNMKYGSKLLQLKEFARHGRKLRGAAEPERDDFASACMADIIRERHPDLMLLHLCAYDSLCHENGRDSDALEAAFQSLDQSVGRVADAVGGEATVIAFSDHAQLNIHTALLPNDLLVARGYLRAAPGGGYELLPGAPGCFIECCGGSAFLHPGSLDAQGIGALRVAVSRLAGFGRFLTAEEMDTCGRAALPFGFRAARGYSCEVAHNREKANHGYSLDDPDYKVFYTVRGAGYPAGSVRQGGCISEVTGVAAAALGIDFPLR